MCTIGHVFGDAARTSEEFGVTFMDAVDAPLSLSV